MDELVEAGNPVFRIVKKGNKEAVNIETRGENSNASAV